MNRRKQPQVPDRPDKEEVPGSNPGSPTSQEPRHSAESLHQPGHAGASSDRTPTRIGPLVPIRGPGTAP
jgi:hypothetical protein